jgi:hypothetical protein
MRYPGECGKIMMICPKEFEAGHPNIRLKPGEGPVRAYGLELCE